jgi:hypothetical protein
MKLIILMVLFIVVSKSWSQGLVLANDREGKSYYFSKKYHDSLSLYQVDQSLLKVDFQNAIKKSPGEICSFKILVNLREDRSYKDYSFLLYLDLLRKHNVIDDLIYRIFKTSLKVGLDFKANEVDLSTIKPEDKLYPLVQFILRDNAKKCFDENLKLLSSDLRKTIKRPVGQKEKKYKFKKELRSILKLAVKKGLLSKESELVLRRAAQSKFESEPLTLSQYQQKKRSLRNQYPISLASFSDEVSEKMDRKNKTSHRMRLFHLYNDVQIIRMGNLVKKMREIMESDKVVISVFDANNVSIDERQLNPADRYDYAIRVLRYELNAIGANPLFEGKMPSYSDLVMSAYELGMVTSEDLETVSKIEEFWNPKKTFWEKSAVWFRLFGSISAIIIPPPYGIMATLAILAIESTTAKEPVDITYKLIGP